MFKKCTYFFLPFLLYSSTYGMQEIIPNYDTLSSPAQVVAQALVYSIITSPNKQKAKEQFAAFVSQLTAKNLNLALFKGLTGFPGDPNNLLTRLNRWNSKRLQAFFKIIQDNGRKGQEEALLRALLDYKAIKKNVFLQRTKDNKAKYDKTDFFGKIIAITGIVGIIAFLYYKHSKVQDYPAQAVKK